ncbi:ABC transporter substrate-binding protein [Paenibacillus ginsengarvi]|uniref:Extracellular solute-binding protein n=1 Tax=Paenibacillus ginsengarvi TaxID=400777 RepID=A0A3B0CDS1_9BACL|nr:extracellular solute-binding protein [Paenibacillus ginsengarvi]RKN84285.1 extracellular solute-binding protein [Paenibacillus ginsengarvi]
MKRVASVSVLLAAAISLAGCSWPAGKETGGKPAATEQKELTILMQDGTSATVKNRIAELEKQAKLYEQAVPGVKVTIEKLAAPKGFAPAVQERLKSDKSADLLFGGFDPLLIEQGALADLLPMFKADKLTTDDLYESLTAMATVKGKLIGIPMAPEPLAVYFNKDWFDKAGVPQPKGDWTWEQFFNAAIKLKAGNTVTGKETYGSAIPFDLQLFESLAQSSGQSIVSPEGNRLSGYLNSKPVTDAVGLLLYHMNSSKASKVVSSGGAQIYNELSNQNVGMAIGQPVNYSLLGANPGLMSKIGVAPLPHMEKGTRANALYFSTMSILSGSKQKEAAWKFVKDVILNSDSAFQKDWGQQELLTSKAAAQKTGQQRDPALSVFIGELSAGIKPAVYKNAALASVSISEKRLVASQSVAEALAALTEMADQIDQQLMDKK